MARIKLLISYDGTDFAGWQLQANARSVQGEVEAAIAKIVGRRLPVQGAGRTDSGVHALGQCAHVDIPDTLVHVPWGLALNGIMRQDVRIAWAGLAHPRFHAQYDALSKTYAYTLWMDHTHVCPLRRRFVWDVPPLDLDAMDQAAAILTGRHDFKSFQNAGTPVGSRGTARTLMGLWRQPGQTSAEVVWRARANGFLKQMVRNLVGCLVEVGKGKVAPADVRSILERRDRDNGLPTAPARGLCMERVEYPNPADCGHDDHQTADCGPAERPDTDPGD